MFFDKICKICRGCIITRIFSVFFINLTMMNLLLICFAVNNFAAATEIDTSYADVLLDAQYSAVNPEFSSFYGGTISDFPKIVDPEVVLGNNDYFLSLPSGSFIIVGFLNNTIINAPDQDDLFIEEIGGNGEEAEVYISSNNNDFTFLGIAKDDQTTSFDFNDIDYNTPVTSVKIIGIDNKGSSPGFDVVSVKAITGAEGLTPCIYSLIITNNGNGNGTVTSKPFGINCGNDCNEIFTKDTKVQLLAVPGQNSFFAGWSIQNFSGIISTENNICNIIMNQNIRISATFYSSIKCDVNGDNKTGIEETIYTLKAITNNESSSINKSNKTKTKIYKKTP